MAPARKAPVALVAGEKIARYGFPDGHPFGPDRHEAFVRELKSEALDQSVHALEPRGARREELETFHTPAYVDLVVERSASGTGFLDAGDTPLGTFSIRGSLKPGRTKRVRLKFTDPVTTGSFTLIVTADAPADATPGQSVSGPAL